MTSKALLFALSASSRVPSSSSPLLLLLGILRVPEHRDALQPRNYRLEDLQALRRDLGDEDGDAGDVASGTRDARDEPGLHGVAFGDHDDGNRLRRLCSRPDRGQTRRDDHVHVVLDQVGGERR